MNPTAPNPRSSVERRPFARALAFAMAAAALGFVANAAVEFALRLAPFVVRSGAKMYGVVFAFVIGTIVATLAVRSAWRESPAPITTTLRRAFVALIGAALLAIPAGPAYARLGVVALLGIAAITYAAQALLGPRAAARAPRLTRACGFVAFQVCATALAAELALRGFAAIRPSPLLARADQSVATNVEAARLKPGSNRFGAPLNSMGYPDTEFTARVAGERRIAVIGDSFVVGVVPHHFHFTTECERQTGANVFALGIPGVGPCEYLHLVETELDALDVDMVVISLFVGNDFVEAEYASRPRSFASDWLRRENVLLFEAPRRFAAIWNESRGRGVLAGSSQGEREQFDRLADPTELIARFPWLDDYRLEKDGHTRKKFAFIESMRAIATCRPNSALPTAAFQALREIRNRVGRTPFAVLVLPDEFQVEDELFAEVASSLESEQLDRDLPQRRLAEFFTREGIRYLDVLPHLRAAPREDDGKLHVYHLRDTHLNRKGNEIVGRALAEFVRNE
jgi:hypothetical protein